MSDPSPITPDAARTLADWTGLRAASPPPGGLAEVFETFRQRVERLYTIDVEPFEFAFLHPIPRAADELRGLSITRAARLLRARTVSPVELTRACLDCIQELDSILKAFITVTADLARAQARRAEREILRGAYRPAFADATVLRVAHACEQACGWTAHFPGGL